MSTTTLKHSIGIDISKDSLSICSCQLKSDLSKEFEFMENQSNDASGFKRLHKWINSNTEQGSEPLVLLEATGVYHEALAMYLFSAGIDVCIMQSGRVKRYAQSLDQRSKTDLLDSKMLSMLACDRSLKLWTPPSKELSQLKGLSRERSVLVANRSIMKNRNHAMERSTTENKQTLKRYNKRLKLLNDQITEIESEMAGVVASDPELSVKMKFLQSIPGISFVASATVVAETLGFSNISSAKQLTSFVGYDVVIKESGTFKGRSKISKKGNKHIRAILHMPSMTAARVNPTLKPFYNRLKEKKEKPIIGLVATQRKLLILMYTLWNKEENYNADILKTKTASSEELAAQDSELQMQFAS
jgi:transposase